MKFDNIMLKNSNQIILHALNLNVHTIRKILKKEIRIKLSLRLRIISLLKTKSLNSLKNTIILFFL